MGPDLPQRITDIGKMRSIVRNWQKLGHSVALVPTMGALHDGHLSLVRQAAVDCDHVVTSIFVNPTQFAPSEDFAVYPRDLAGDTRLLATAGCQAVFCPSEADIYPDNFSTSIDVGSVAKPWEGASRPTHFAGVATVVCKLLNIVPADSAYFGRKDYQQTLVVGQMVRDLNLATRICVCPIVRESDGLAMSSRNAYLSPDERTAALVLNRSLLAAKKLIDEGEIDGDIVQKFLVDQIAEQPMVSLDYAAVLVDGTVRTANQITGTVTLAVAARVGQTRLIDNVKVEAASSVAASSDSN